MKKSRILLSSLLTILLCVSLIAGATFALFTSESKTNIAITGGSVNVIATAGIGEAWSAEWSDGANGYVRNTDLTKITNGYEFTNKGTAVYTGNTVTVSNITPGDGLNLNIDILNRSDVKTKYRIEVRNTELHSDLLDKLAISYKLGNEQIELNGRNPRFSDWMYLDEAKDTKNGDKVGPLQVEIELPITMDESYQGKTANLEITVFVAQINANIEDPVATSIETSTTIGKYAGENNWTSAERYNQIDLDEVVTVVTTEDEDGRLNGTYDADAQSWNLYQSENATLTINALHGYELVSFTITYVTGNTQGTLKVDEQAIQAYALTREVTYSNVLTGETYLVSEANKDRVTLVVSSLGDGDGEVHVTDIQVVYRSVQELTECEHEWGDGVVTIEPTCTNTGVRTYTCPKCRQTKKETIDKIPHTPEEIAAVEPTCETAGATAGSKCSVCGEILTQPETIPARGHKWDIANMVWNWSNDYSSATATLHCNNDPEHNHSQTVTAKVSHSDDTATCESGGQITHTATATFRGIDEPVTAEVTKDTSALGHIWKVGENDIVWAWGENNTTATATFTCERDGSHTKTIDADVKSETVAATCEKDGSITYTATVTGPDGETYTNTVTEILDKLDHQLGAWTEEGATHIRKCERDNCNYTETHNAAFGAWEIEEDQHIRSCQEQGCDITEKHTASIGNWEKADNKHERKCAVEDCTIGESHDANFATGDWAVDSNGKHSHKCQSCDIIESHDANFATDDWKDAGDGQHGHTCQATGCNVTETAPHGELAWNISNTEHYQYCTFCNYKTSSEPHDYDDTWHQDTDGKHYQKCTVCGSETTHEAHSSDQDYIVDGDTHYQACDACGEKFNSQQHAWTITSWIWPDNMDDVDTDHVAATFKCNVCNDTRTVYANSVQPATYHDADCVTDGYATYTATVVGPDGANHNDTSDEYPILANGQHTVDAKDGLAATCEDDGYIAYYQCSVCKKLFKDALAQSEITDFDQWINTSQDQGGGLINKFGHDWANATATWDFDYVEKTATATITCGREKCDHSVQVPANELGEQEVRAADCVNDRTFYYTASVEYEGKTFNTTDTVLQTQANSALGHILGAWTVVDDMHRSTCTRNCGYYIEHKATMSDWAVSTTVENTHERHCTAEGCDINETHEAQITDWAKVETDSKHERHCEETGCTINESHDATNWSGWTDHSRTCNTCGIKDSHDADYGDAWYQDDAGKHYQKCTVCDSETTHEAHNYGEVEWTVNSEGKHERTCETCKASETHVADFGNWLDHQDGRHTGYCEDCNLTVTETCAYDKHKCTKCGHIETQQISSQNIFDTGIWGAENNHNFTFIAAGNVKAWLEQFNALEIYNLTTENAADYLEILVEVYSQDTPEELYFSTYAPFGSQTYGFDALMKAWVKRYFDNNGKDGETLYFTIQYSIVLKAEVNGEANKLLPYFTPSQKAIADETAIGNFNCRRYTFNISALTVPNDIQLNFTPNDGECFEFLRVGGNGSIFLNGGIDYVAVKWEKDGVYYVGYFFPKDDSGKDAQLLMYTNTDKTGNSLECGTVGNGWCSISGFNSWVISNYGIDGFDAKEWNFSTRAHSDGSYYLYPTEWSDTDNWSEPTNWCKEIGHSYGEPTWAWEQDNSSATATFTCAYCGRELPVTATNDEVKYSVKEQPTCTKEGIGVYTATVAVEFGAKTYTGTKEVTLAMVAHDLTNADKHTAEVPATCEGTGTHEYWQCDVCGKYFSTNGDNPAEIGDSEALAKWLQEDGVIPAKGHNKQLVHTPRLEPTCTTKGREQYWTCPDCGANFKDEQAQQKVDDLKDLDIDMIAHSWTVERWNWATDINKVSTDTTATIKCSKCSVTETVKADVTAGGRTEPSCTEQGSASFTATVTTKDGQTLTGSTTYTLAMVDHTYGQLIGTTPSTCIQPGMAAHYQCSVCSKLFVLEDDKYVEKTETDLQLELVDHNYVATFSWPKNVNDVNATSVTGTITCSVCQDKQPLTIIKVEENEGKVLPECEKEGSVTFHVTGSYNGTPYEGNSETYTLAALEHVYTIYAGLSDDGSKHILKCELCEKATQEFAHTIEGVTPVSCGVSDLYNHKYSCTLKDCEGYILEEHKFNGTDCICGEPLCKEEGTVELNTNLFNEDQPGNANGVYDIQGSATISDMTFEWEGLGHGVRGSEEWTQWRSKHATTGTSAVWNTQAFAGNIITISFVWYNGSNSPKADVKDGHLTIELANSADFSDAVTEYVILTAGTTTFTVNGSYTFVRITHNDQQGVYLSNIVITYGVGNHVWDEGNLSEEATCTHGTITQYTCIRCGATYTQDDGITNNEHSYDNNKQAHDDYFHWIVCDNGCGTIKEGSKDAHDLIDFSPNDADTHNAYCTTCDSNVTQSHYYGEDDSRHACDCGDWCYTEDTDSGEEKFTASQASSARQGAQTTVKSSGAFEFILVLDKGSNTIHPENNNYGHVRVYANNTITITAPTGTIITGIQFNAISSYNSLGTGAASTGTLNGLIWSGSITEGNSVKFTNKSGSQFRFTEITITYTYTTTTEEHKHLEVERQNATCTEDGYIKYTCARCGDTYQDTIEAPGHTYTDKWGRNDTEHWQICDICEQLGESTPHNWGYDQIDASLHKSSCECGVTKEEPHNFSKWDSDNDNHWKVCDKCNTKDESSIKAHDDLINFNSNDDEKHTATCNTCDGTVTQDHNYVDGVCTVEGCNHAHEKHSFGTDGKCETCGADKPEEGETVWQLVTNGSDLKVDDEIVIVASTADFAMSTTQNNNNRGQTGITKNSSDNTVTINDDVAIIKLKEGEVKDTFAFYVINGLSTGYLYAASSSSNYLRTQASNNADSSWSVSIAAGTATVTAQGNYTRNILRYNSSDKLFSCYASGQQAIQIYKKTTGSTTTPGEGGDPEIPSGSTKTLTITTSTQGWTNSTSLDGVSKTIDNITLKMAKGSGSTNPAYYDTGTALRLYYGNTLTITGKAIKKVTFTISSGGNSNTISSNTGACNGYEWEGSTTELIITVGTNNGANSGHIRIAKITIEYVD